MSTVSAFLNQLYSNFLGRRTLYSFVLLILCIGTFDFEWVWLFYGVVFYYIIKPLQLTTWHEYIAHRLIQPRNKLIEFFGLYILAVYEFSGPKNKVIYHDLHHRYERSDFDPTFQRLINSKSMLHFCLDLGKLSEIHYTKALDQGITNKLTAWFDQNHQKIIAATLIIWLVFFPIWTWICFWLAPVFFWNVTNRIGEYMWHHPDYDSKEHNWLVFIFSQNAWHISHHNQGKDVTTPQKSFYGPGLWKYLNWDYYVALLFFKKLKEI